MKHFPGSRTLAALLCASALAAGALLGDAPGGARAKGNGQVGGWTVLAPVSYKNLTIFPVRGADLAGAADYITLDEGTKAGTVVITEKGAQSARIARRPANAHA